MSAQTVSTIAAVGKVAESVGATDPASSSSSGATATELHSASEVIPGSGENEAAERDIDPETTIFVGNLVPECTEQDLKDIFGQDVEVELPVSKSGKQYKQRYAFVKFPSKIDFRAVKQQHSGQTLKGRPMNLKQALTRQQREQNKHQRAGTYRQYRSRYNNGYRKPNGTNGSASAANAEGEANGVSDSLSGAATTTTTTNSSSNNNSNSNTNGRRQPKKFFARHAVPAPPKKERLPLEEMEQSTDTVYVNNVAFSATKESIAEFFGTKPELIVLPMKRMRDTHTLRNFYSKTMNRGIAFVAFEGLKNDKNDFTEIAKKVEAFNGKTFMDRTITVDIAKKPQDSGSEESKQQAASGAAADAAAAATADSSSTATPSNPAESETVASEAEKPVAGTVASD